MAAWRHFNGRCHHHHHRHQCRYSQFCIWRRQWPPWQPFSGWGPQVATQRLGVKTQDVMIITCTLIIIITLAPITNSIIVIIMMITSFFSGFRFQNTSLSSTALFSSVYLSMCHRSTGQICVISTERHCSVWRLQCVSLRVCSNYLCEVLGDTTCARKLFVKQKPRT